MAVRQPRGCSLGVDVRCRDDGGDFVPSLRAWVALRLDTRSLSSGRLPASRLVGWKARSLAGTSRQVVKPGVENRNAFSLHFIPACPGNTRVATTWPNSCHIKPKNQAKLVEIAESSNCKKYASSAGFR